MKKFVALIAMLVATLTLTVPVRAATVDDVISKITEVQAPEAKPEDWDRLVDFFKNAHIEEIKSGDPASEYQMRVLVDTLERSIMQPYHNEIRVDCGIGIWEKDLKEKEKIEKMLETICNAFRAKTGKKLWLEKTKEKPEDGYTFYRFYTDVPEYELHQVTNVGKEAVVQNNYNNGRYFESAWADGSGRFGKIGNQYISSGDIVTIVKVAYLDKNNEVVEVVSEKGFEIETYRRRMLLAKKGETVLGWFHPENIVTE